MRLDKPMTDTPIAVTGATGRLGGRVARRLAVQSVPQRLVVRDPSRAPELEATTVAVADYADVEAARRALDGVRVLFMVSGAEAADRVAQHTAFIDAAATAGVEHIVYTSFYGAAPHATFTLGRDHWATEEHIKARGLGFTFLRDNLYADFVPLLGGDDGVIRGPAGDGRTSLVAIDDIADCAVAVLTTPFAHLGQTYHLTGPEALNLHDAARVAAEVTGRPLRYEEETLEEAYRSREQYGAPRWQLDAWVSTYTAIASGEMDGVSEDVPNLTRRPGTTLAEVLQRG